VCAQQEPAAPHSEVMTKQMVLDASVMKKLALRRVRAMTNSPLLESRRPRI
jgi:hypothetical protein